MSWFQISRIALSVDDEVCSINVISSKHNFKSLGWWSFSSFIKYMPSITFYFHWVRISIAFSKMHSSKSRRGVWSEQLFEWSSSGWVCSSWLGLFFLTGSVLPGSRSIRIVLGVGCSNSTTPILFKFYNILFILWGQFEIYVIYTLLSTDKGSCQEVLEKEWAYAKRNV